VSTYTDKSKCPKGHAFSLLRRATSAGKVVSTFCQTCSRMYQIKAGPTPSQKAERTPAMRKPTERQYEKAAADVAFSYAPQILECQKCGWPHANGYVCRYCGDENPKQPKDKKKEKAA
jgi:ribosomal protein L32